MSEFKIALKSLFARGLTFLAETGCLFPVVYFYLLFCIRERDSQGKNRCISARRAPSVSDEIRILALGSESFRGDLEVLAAVPRMRVFVTTYQWQVRLLCGFYANVERNSRLTGPRYYQATLEEDPDASIAKTRAREFLKVYLASLYKHLPIDVVITHNVRHPYSLDWGAVSKTLGHHFLVIYRENLYLSQHTFKMASDRHKQFGKFEGDMVVTHSQRARATLVESGFVPKEQTRVVGMFRLDPFLKKINSEQKSEPPSRLTVFWWAVTTYKTESLRTMSAGVLDTVLELCSEREGLRVVIKPKPENTARGKIGSKQMDVERYLTEKDGCWRERGQISVEPYADVHELILGSRVVSGLQSTTLIEAAIAGRPVVIPFFREIEKEIGSNEFALQPIEDHFLISRDLYSYKNDICAALDGQAVDAKTKAKRERFFLENFGRSDGENLGGMINVLEELVTDS